MVAPRCAGLQVQQQLTATAPEQQEAPLVPHQAPYSASAFQSYVS